MTSNDTRRTGQPVTVVDWTAVAVAAWLTERPRRQVPLAALGALLRNVPHARRREAAAALLAALAQLDSAGLIVFAHHFPTPVVGVLDQAGLRCVAATPAVAIQQKVGQTTTAWRPHR